jgi:hypothetical protein
MRYVGPYKQTALGGGKAGTYTSIPRGGMSFSITGYRRLASFILISDALIKPLPREHKAILAALGEWDQD